MLKLTRLLVKLSYQAGLKTATLPGYHLVVLQSPGKLTIRKLACPKPLLESCLAIFGNGRSDSLPLFCFLLARSKSQVPPTLRGGGFLQGHEYWEVGPGNSLHPLHLQVRFVKTGNHCSRCTENYFADFWSRAKDFKQCTKTKPSV